MRLPTSKVLDAPACESSVACPSDSPGHHQSSRLPWGAGSHSAGGGSLKPEQLEGVRLLKEFITQTKSPVLLVLAKHELFWHAENGQPAEVAKGVSEALALISPSLELDIATALTNALYDLGRGKNGFHDGPGKLPTDLAARFLKELPGAVGITKIESVLSDIHQARAPRSGAQLLWDSVETRLRQS